MTTLLEDLADIEISNPDDVRNECRCENTECNEFGNLLRCYMDLQFKEKCIYYIKFMKSGGVEE